MTKEELVKEIEDKKEIYGIVNYSFSGTVLAIKTEEGYSKNAIHFINDLMTRYPEFITAGRAETEAN
ncbi:hypothetical protein J537_1026 [Acinetobacter baumannii 1437282]|nr:hypothetical protein J537_1026 [Acinetobacter baumannii 1437282]